jgi:hypothetical protein
MQNQIVQTILSSIVYLCTTILEHSLLDFKRQFYITRSMFLCTSLFDLALRGRVRVNFSEKMKVGRTCCIIHLLIQSFVLISNLSLVWSKYLIFMIKFSQKCVKKTSNRCSRVSWALVQCLTHKKLPSYEYHFVQFWKGFQMK